MKIAIRKCHYPTDLLSFETKNGEYQDSYNESYWRVKDGLVYSNLNEVPCGASLRHTNAAFCVINGDLRANELTAYARGKEFVSLSFTCLTRFLFEDPTIDNINACIGKFHSGELKVIDATFEEQRRATQEEKEEVKKNPQYVPEMGFTAIRKRGVGLTWHRPSTVLIQNQKEYYLLGQDEGQYFGCQLPRGTKSISKAFSLLAPKAAVKNGQLIPGTLRQGEWFFVPVDEANLPNLHECIRSDQIALPKSSEDGIAHIVYADCYIHANRIYLGASNYDTFVEHEQHQSLIFKKNRWYSVHRNTAIRSFSEEGTD